MALIVEELLMRGIGLSGKYVGVYLQIPKERLSSQYNIPLFSSPIVVGEILEIKKQYGELVGEELKLKELVGKRVEFILGVSLLGTYDFLYISEASWPLFRDYGVFPMEYRLKVRLMEIRSDSEVTQIYPKRDVVI